VKPLKLAVVGAGYMGSRHAERAAALSGGRVELVGVADPDAGRARAVAKRTGARAVASADELIHECEAAIVAVPSVDHERVVAPWLRAGRHVLVEKPIAATLEQGDALLALAEHSGCLLQVGHLEWFNAGMQVIRERIDRPLFAEVHRMGPYPERSTDVDVVRDVMIHDLEILQRLLGEEPDRIDAIGVPVLSSEVDIANARLHFPGGCVANITASRVSATPMRKLRFFQRDGYFSIDFLAQTAVVFRREPAASGEAPKIGMERLETDPADALELQLVSFIDAIRERRPPAVDAAGGLAALRTALRVRDAMPDPDLDALDQP
jgi:predicted dehydrogenase